MGRSQSSLSLAGGGTGGARFCPEPGLITGIFDELLAPSSSTGRNAFHVPVSTCSASSDQAGLLLRISVGESLLPVLVPGCGGAGAWADGALEEFDAKLVGGAIGLVIGWGASEKPPPVHAPESLEAGCGKFQEGAEGALGACCGAGAFWLATGPQGLLVLPLEAGLSQLATGLALGLGEAAIGWAGSLFIDGHCGADGWFDQASLTGAGA